MSKWVERLRVPLADSVKDRYMRDVVGKKADAAATGAVDTTSSLMAYIKQLIGASRAAGTTVVAESNVVSSGIPNNTQTGGAITGAATGDILIEDILFATDSTGLAAPTNIEISTDNVNGNTGAAAPVLVELIASFGANLFVSKKDATSHTFPFILESGKKLFIHGDDAAGTGTGEVNITIIGKAIDAGATLAGADIAAA